MALTTHLHLAVEVKEREELYLPFWAFVTCCRVDFTFIFNFTLHVTKLVVAVLKYFRIFLLFVSLPSSASTFETW